MKELYDYQKDIVNSILSSSGDDIICLPTGAGKTVIAGALVKELPKPVVFAAPRIILLGQALDEMTDSFGDVGIISAAKTSYDSQACAVASKDTLASRYKSGDIPGSLISDIKHGTLILDEAHWGIKQSWELVSMMEPGRVLGLTATPERADGLALLKGTDAIHEFGIFDSLLQKETIPSLIRKGRLSSLRYFSRPIDGILDIRPSDPRSGELSGKQMTDIFNRYGLWGDLVSSYEEYGRGRPALGFTTTVAMGEQVVSLFRDAGYDFRIIHGEMPVKEQNELISLLSSGGVDGLVNAELLTYGFDCPPVSYAFNCRHVKSRPFWFQMVGRILRTSPGKQDAIFMDHADSVSEFTEPGCALPILDEFIKWHVDGETREEKKDKQSVRKKHQESFRLLQDLDPAPGKMVEIKPEDNFERLMRVVDKLLKENTHMKEVIEGLRQEAEESRFAAAAAAPRLIDSDATFEYIRTHYPRYRRHVENKNPGISPADAHRYVVSAILKDGESLPFIFDRIKLENGFSYWENHWTPV